MCAKLLLLCPTLCKSIAYSLPGSSVHGILQARILECVIMPFPNMYMDVHIYTSSPIIGSSNPIPKYIPKRINNLHKTTYIQMYVAALFIISQT